MTTEGFNQYTPGSIIQLHGENLRFDKTAPDQGVFLSDDNEEIRLSVYSRIGRTRIDALVPTGTAGQKQVVVRTRQRGCFILR